LILNNVDSINIDSTPHGMEGPQKLPACAIPVKLTARSYNIREWMHKIQVCAVQVQAKSEQLLFSKQSRKWMFKGRI